MEFTIKKNAVSSHSTNGFSGKTQHTEPPKTNEEISQASQRREVENCEVNFTDRLQEIPSGESCTGRLTYVTGTWQGLIDSRMITLK